jgi:hypothetical protein
MMTSPATTSLPSASSSMWLSRSWTRICRLRTSGSNTLRGERDCLTTGSIGRSGCGLASWRVARSRGERTGSAGTTFSSGSACD